MPPVQRHDLLVLTTEGRERLCRNMRAGGAPSRDLMAELFGGFPIPAIVRRRAPCDQTGIGVGISFPVRENGQRLRFAAAVASSEIADMLSPYAIVERSWDMSIPPLRALRAIKDLDLTRPGNLGVFGASALQVVTGMDYLHSRSDLDLIIRREGIDSLQRIDRELSALERDMEIAFDVEVILGNGGGVKLKELCSRQKTILVKSILSVEIVNKHTAIQSLLAA